MRLVALTIFGIALAQCSPQPVAVNMRSHASSGSTSIIDPANAVNGNSPTTTAPGATGSSTDPSATDSSGSTSTYSSFTPTVQQQMSLASWTTLKANAGQVLVPDINVLFPSSTATKASSATSTTYTTSATTTAASTPCQVISDTTSTPTYWSVVFTATPAGALPATNTQNTSTPNWTVNVPNSCNYAFTLSTTNGLDPNTTYSSITIDLYYFDGTNSNYVYSIYIINFLLNYPAPMFVYDQALAIFKQILLVLGKITDFSVYATLDSMYQASFNLISPGGKSLLQYSVFSNMIGSFDLSTVQASVEMSNNITGGDVALQAEFVQTNAASDIANSVQVLNSAGFDYPAMTSFLPSTYNNLFTSLMGPPLNQTTGQIYTAISTLFPLDSNQCVIFPTGDSGPNGQPLCPAAAAPAGSGQ